VQTRVEAFIVDQYAAGRSLRGIAELTHRPFSPVRNILNKHGIMRRGVGTAVIAVDNERREEPGPMR
jgi:hypothetical protein